MWRRSVASEMRTFLFNIIILVEMKRGKAKVFLLFLQLVKLIET